MLLPSTGGQSAAGPPNAGTPGHPGNVPSIIRSPESAQAVVAVHPAGGGPRLTYYGNNSTFATLPVSNEVCDLYTSTASSFGRICDATAQNPSAVALANGNVGVAYSRMSDLTGNTCPGAARNTTIRVAWAVSSNGGQSFGAPVDLGNDSCAYEQATEPSFGRGAGSDVVGVYVQYNSTNASAYLGGKTWMTPWNLYRKNATLGFVESTNNGTTWSTPVTLTAAGSFVARPSLATFGSTIYVAYDTLSGTQTLFTGESQTPHTSPAVSVNLVYSTNEGASWTGPIALPGLNLSELNNSMSPSLAVSSNGTLGISYFTNRSCYPAGCKATASSTYTDDLVFTESYTNGSTWRPLTRVVHALVEDYVYSDIGAGGWFSVLGYRFFYEFEPAAALAFDGSRIVVVECAVNYSLSLTPFVGVYASVSANNGSSWTTSTIRRISTYSDEIYAPGIGVAANGQVTVEFTWENQTSCGNPCNPVDSAYSEWIATSGPGGVGWNATVLSTVVHPSLGLGASGADWTGWTGSVVFPGGGSTPDIIYALSQPYTDTVQTHGSQTWTNYSWQSGLYSAYPYAAATTTLNFSAVGLAGGLPWGVQVQGQHFGSTGLFINISGIPVNQPVQVALQVPNPRGWEQLKAVFYPALSYMPKFSGPTTIQVNFTEKFGFTIGFHPSTPCPPYEFDLYFNNGGSTFQYYCSGSTYTESPAFPWYLVAGQKLTLTPTEQWFAGGSYWSYWFGTGNGSYSGPGVDANLTLKGPVNESVWVSTYGTGNVTFYPSGVPASSTVSFDLGGKLYSGSGGGPINLPNVTTGPQSLGNITATSTTAGWEYFGTASCGATLVVPAEQQVNLSFAYVEVGSPAGSVPFHGSGLLPGTAWQLWLNGTTYASNRSTFNATLHNGTYPYRLVPSVAPDGATGYVPTTSSGFVNVTVGTTTSFSFRPGYRVQAAPGLGGTITGPALVWVAAGQYELYTATASSGFSFAGWTGNGSGSYTGTNASINITVQGPIVETAEFYALPTAHFNASFSESGLANGTTWSVFVGGIGYSSNASTILVPNLLSCSAGAAGTYNLSVPYVYNGTNGTRWVPPLYPGKFCDPGSYARAFVFGVEFELSVGASPGGLALAGTASGETNSSVWVPSTVAPSLTAQAFGNNTFLNWNGTGAGAYSGPLASTSLSLGGPVSELAVFVPPLPVRPPRYTLSIVEGGLPAGTAWSVLLNGTGYAASGPVLNITGLPNGTYTLAVPTTLASDGLSKFVASSAPTQVKIHGRPAPQSVAFATSYWVSVSGSPGGTVSPSGGSWIVKGGSLQLRATPDAGYVFLGWTGNSSFSSANLYTGANATPGAIRVVSPLTEHASFGPQPPAPKAVSSPFNTPAVWAGFAVVGAGVGLLVGVLLARRRGTPVAPEPGPEPGPESTEPGAGPEPGSDEGST